MLNFLEYLSSLLAMPTRRINVKQRVTYGDIHERFDVRNGHRFFVDLNGDLLPESVAELFEDVAWNVGDQGAGGIVEADDVASDTVVCGCRSFQAHNQPSLGSPPAGFVMYKVFDRSRASIFNQESPNRGRHDPEAVYPTGNR